MYITMGGDRKAVTENSTPGRDSKRWDGRCKPHTGAAGRHSGARAGNGPPSLHVTEKECAPVSGTNSGGTTDRLIRPEPFLARGVFFVFFGVRISPPGFAPGASVQQTQAQPVNRTGNKFCPPRAPVGPEKTARKHSCFCAPELLLSPTRSASPVMGSGVQRLGAPERCSSERTPGAFC